MDTFFRLLEVCSQNINDKADVLNDLDQQIGDGDHGTNMARGFNALIAKKDSFKDKTLAQILKESAMVLISQVAGSAGPLYGTAVLKAGDSLKDIANPQESDYIVAYRAAVEGVQFRGKSDKGEKTMLDVLIPVLELMEKENKAGKSLKEMSGEIIKVAQERVEYTKTIIATKGRAAYLGERSLGVADPGAYSSMILFESLVQVLEEGN